MKKLMLAGALLAAGVVAGIQFVPAMRDNPPAAGEITAPPEVAALLRRACYDCHSNQTRWRWYSHIAPLSWLIAHDVELGRKEINFSDWGSYYPITRKRKLEWVDRALREQAMPPWPYRLMHPDARLSASDRALLERWIESALAGPLVHPTKRQLQQ
ncbi:MAG: heme-binding domain-containing protein [Candidatus Binataceae bacterium]